MFRATTFLAALVLTAMLFAGCTTTKPARTITATTLPIDWNYSQDFASGSGWDADRDGVKLKWCDSKDWNAHSGCDGRGAMRVVKSGGDTIICIAMGDVGYTRASIKFKYYHLQIDNDPANSAGSKLQVRVSPDDDPNGMSLDGTYMTLASLDATCPPHPAPVCTPAEASVDLHPGDKTVYFKIMRGSYPRAIIVDDVQVSLTSAPPKMPK